MAVGKTAGQQQHDRSRGAGLGRRLCEVPVGFKWFVEGLLDGSLGFGGEESAGASFLRRDGTVWTTDKDGLITDLLAAEITARTGKDPGEHYRALTAEFGTPVLHADRRPGDAGAEGQAGEAVPRSRQGSPSWPASRSRQTDRRPGQQRPYRRPEGRPPTGWFAARPSGTENIYKIYAESFRDQAHSTPSSRSPADRH